uniref:Uncharacterized protein n=1 Tax=Arundo donax TaxID=35708 RepID=A0A0A8ZTI1_ARUDO
MTSFLVNWSYKKRKYAVAFKYSTRQVRIIKKQPKRHLAYIAHNDIVIVHEFSNIRCHTH